MTGSEDGGPAVCDRWSSEGHWWRWTRVIVSSQRSIGGAGRLSGVVQVKTEFQGDVQCRLLEIWMYGRGEEWGTAKNGQGCW